MKQHRKPKSRRAPPALSALVCPACESCGSATRFVGLEATASSDHADLCTYECNACGHTQANVVPRMAHPNGNATRLAHY